MSSNRYKKVRWTNRFSGEQGYVKSVQRVRGYFENTFNIRDAKKYKSVNECNEDIKYLESLGELENNIFDIVDIRY